MKRLLSILAAALIISSFAIAAAAPDLTAYELPVIANKDNNLSHEYVPELVSVPGTYFHLEQETLTAYTDMLSAAKDAGHNYLRLQSAYRSYDTQHILHERKVANYKSIYGDNAREMAARVVARPGQSEHQLGNTIDIANGSLVQSFGRTAAGIWLKENAHLYGFILRYPDNKTEITGVIYEPWHFRYVGKDIAKIIYDNEWTLEEFVQYANSQKEKSASKTERSIGTDYQYPRGITRAI